MILLKRSTAALAVLLVSGGVAAAAVAQTDLNIRSNPGGQVIGVIPAGATVDTLGCGPRWCKVMSGGQVGYASAGYLSTGSGTAEGARAFASQPRLARSQRRPTKSVYAKDPDASFSDQAPSGNIW